LDPVSSQLVQSQLLSAIDDMGQVLARNAASREIAEERDFAVAIALERGEVVALDNLLHLGAVIDTAARIQELFQFAMKPGDVVLSNDPYSGGTHIQDFTALAPFHHRREGICYLVCRAHLPDLCGQVPGGYFPFADDVWAEGSRIPPLKIVQEGKIVGDKLDAVVMNSRSPDLVTINLQAMLAALATGQRRLEQIVKKYGTVEIREGMRASIAATEGEVATALRNWTCGKYEGVSVIDHDVKRGEPLQVRATLTISPDKLTVDFSGSSAQSPGFVNSTRSNTVGHALVPLYAAIRGRAPVNSGLLARTEID
jgi:N-methylhydantoinase B